MLLKYLKQNMLSPEKEILINKIVKIRGIDVHLISITLEENARTLWVIYQEEEIEGIPSYFHDEAGPQDAIELPTNRDIMSNSINERLNSHNIFISELVIQGHKVTFHSSSSSRVTDENPKEYMKLQHFIENGMTTAYLDEVDLRNIVITAYKQEESENFPEIDLSKELDITLKVSEGTQQVLINQPVYLEFGEIKVGEKLYYYNSVENKSCAFYLNKLEHYDIWKETTHFFEDDRFKAFTPEEQQQMKESHLSCIEQICPKGMNLAMLEYEEENDVQLNFYTKEFLDKRPVHSNSASSVGMIFGSDRKFGINGFRSRLCMIKPIEKDFQGSIDVELFSCYIRIPEEVIKV